MTKSVLVLGGAGFIGTHLAARLVNAGHDVTIVDNLSFQVHMGKVPDVANMRLRLFQADCESEGWIRAVTAPDRKFDVIVHLVAETGTGQSMYQALRYCRTNVNSMALLNDMLLPLTPTKKASGSSKVDGRPSESFALQTGRVIVASSRAVYGEAGLDQFGVPMPSKEGDATNPKSVYAVTKLAQENLLFAGFQGLQKCAVRFQNVYGEGQALTNPYTGVASAFVAAALDGRDINVYSDGQMTRDFVHVQDAVRALSMCIESELPPPEILNVGTGRATTILQLAEAIVQLSGSQSEIKVLGGELLGDVRNNYADTSRARAFGFQAETDLHQGLLSLIEWAKSADRTDSNLLYRRAQNEMLANGVLR